LEIRMKYVIGIGALIIAVLIIIAIIPQKDCAGNNTWKTSETCQTGK